LTIPPVSSKKPISFDKEAFRVDLVEKLKRQAILQGGIGAAEAFDLVVEGAGRPFSVLAAASEIREHFKGRQITLCGISNAKSGRCSEDCAFCAQSSRYPTDAPVYPLKTAERIADEAAKAARGGAEFFGIVTSGRRIRARREWAAIFKAIEGIGAAGLKPCASLGIIDAERARELKAAGLSRYHHNLETSRSYFPNICTTHAYEEDVETVRTARAAGLAVCSGGVIGLGEGISHRIELAALLKELDVEAVPLNILNPVKGTPLARTPSLPPLEILMTIAVFRFMLPEKEIKLCGGKERNLRQLLPLGIVAGANSLLTGDCPTTGRDSALDVEMVLDLGLVPTREANPLCACEARREAKTPSGKKKAPKAGGRG
jgi:biotin synthase